MYASEGLRVRRPGVDWVGLVLTVALAALLAPIGTELWLFLKGGQFRQVAVTFVHQNALLQSSVLAVGFCILLSLVQMMAQAKLSLRDTFGLALRGIVLGYLTTFLISILLGTTRAVYASFDENRWAYGLEACSLMLYLLVDSIDLARKSSPAQS